MFHTSFKVVCLTEFDCVALDQPLSSALFPCRSLFGTERIPMTQNNIDRIDRD